MRYLCLPLFLFFCLIQFSFAQNGCEPVMTAVLQKLPNVLTKNDFGQLKTIINTLKGTCEKNELGRRLEIISQLLQKQNTSLSIKAYLEGHYDDMLIQRFDAAAARNANGMYRQAPKKYQYFPLNHPVDSLLKLKAAALLQSQSYALNTEETTISYLFADHIDEFLRERNRKPVKTASSTANRYPVKKSIMNGPTIGLSAGIFSPFDSNPIFDQSGIFGISYMGSLNNSIVSELVYKFRVHNNSRPFDMRYKQEIREVNPNSSHFIGLGLGYKAYDNGTLVVLLPKINTGLGFIWTGLSDSYYYTDEWGIERKSTSLRNVKTWQNSIGITSMIRLQGKTFIGVELNYHLIPYNWDDKLVPHVPSDYGSAEFFIRF
ncbi:hypothetical protein [Sphingobacterium paucimobilis]|nr:hypothetical protein [Sphingobacterium paucimobilis]